MAPGSVQFQESPFLWRTLGRNVKLRIHSQEQRKNTRVGAWSVALRSSGSLCSHTVQDRKGGNDTVHNALASAMSTIKTSSTDTSMDHPYLDSSSAEFSSQVTQGPSRLTVTVTQHTSSSKLKSFQSCTRSIRDLSKFNVFFPLSFLSSLTPTPFSLFPFF